MTLKEFLRDKTLEAVELLDFNHNQIINVYVNGGACYGLVVDLTGVVSGTPLTYTTDFTLDGDMLTVSDFSVDIKDVNML